MNRFVTIGLLTYLFSHFFSSSALASRKCNSHKYYSQDYLDSIKKKRVTPVIVVSGWSDTSLQSSSLKSAYKQTRAFSSAYLLAARLYQKYGRVKLIYLSTVPISEHYRRYLYRIATGDQGIAGFQGFEKFTLKMFVFDQAKHSEALIENFEGLDDIEKIPVDTYKFFSKRNVGLLKVIKNLLAIYAQSKRYDLIGFDNHSNSPLLRVIAYYLGIPLLGNTLLDFELGSKSQSRKIFEDAGVLHPKGSYFPIAKLDHLAEDIYELLKTGTRKVLIKIDRSSAGEGLQLVDFSDELTEGFINLYEPGPSNKLIRMKLYELPFRYLEKIVANGAIVEEYLESPGKHSPAAMLMINNETDIDLIGLYQQKLGGNLNLCYQGCESPLEDQEESQLIGKKALSIGLTLAKLGIRGPIGVDFLSCQTENRSDEEKILAIENNIRHPSTMYAYMNALHLLGESCLKTKYFETNECLRVPTLINSTIRNQLQAEFYRWLSFQTFTFKRETGKGVLIFGDYGAIGKLSALAIADSPVEASQLLKLADKEIKEHIRQWGAKYARKNLMKAEI